MTDDQLQAAVHSAINDVKAETPTLNFRHVHEQATAHRLAVHFENRFDGWNVDCEYDRKEQIRKMLPGIANCERSKSTDWILPDIVVHHRESTGRMHNLLVVELKKNAPKDPCDQRKLELFTAQNSQYEYQLGLFININGDQFDCTWYKDGREIEEAFKCD